MPGHVAVVVVAGGSGLGAWTGWCRRGLAAGGDLDGPVDPESGLRGSGGREQNEGARARHAGRSHRRLPARMVDSSRAPLGGRGLWGGKSEEERVAGYWVDLSVGWVARYPRGQGKPVSPRPGSLASHTHPVPGVTGGVNVAGVFSAY